jgi:ABC-type Fe3+-hydroxamate transport system substrate-binding protein
MVPYEDVKRQTVALIEAFSNEHNIAAALEMERAFHELEERIAAMRARTAGIRIMVLQSELHSHFIQTPNGFLGSMMRMMGFTNVVDRPGLPLVALDMEAALYFEPDWIFAIGASPSAEGHRALMATHFANNPAYWNSIRAIRENNIVYMPVSFISSAGIAIVDLFHELIYLVEDLLP